MILAFHITLRAVYEKRFNIELILRAVYENRFNIGLILRGCLYNVGAIIRKRVQSYTFWHTYKK